MQIVHRIEDVVRDPRSVVTVGMFDGVHRAHQEIIGWTVKEARAHRGRSVVVTFDPHPKEVVGDPGQVDLLTTLEERREQFARIGVELLLIVRFDLAFAGMSFSDFTERFLVNGIGATEVVEGYDHHWGRNREGNVAALQELGLKHGFSVKTLEPLRANNILVNSSNIRQLLREGRAAEAGIFLRRPYRLTGMVIRGDQRGRLLGYPTANLQLPSPRKLVPKNGIYFTKVVVGGKDKTGLLSIGVRPTFVTSGRRTIEVHILDFDADIYGETIHVDLLERMRDEQRFESADDLVKQMKRDEADARIRKDDYSMKS